MGRGRRGIVTTRSHKSEVPHWGTVYSESVPAKVVTSPMVELAQTNQSINQSLFKHGKIQQELKIKNNLTILNKIQNLTTNNLTKTCFS